jgi:hypothetical protein
MAVDLPKASTPCKATIFYDALKDEDGRGVFSAHICIPAGEKHHVEYQTAWAGSRRVMSFHETGEEANVHPKHFDGGCFLSPEPIQDVGAWKKWLSEYVSMLDPEEVVRDRQGLLGGA